MTQLAEASHYLILSASEVLARIEPADPDSLRHFPPNTGQWVALWAPAGNRAEQLVVDSDIALICSTPGILQLLPAVGYAELPGWTVLLFAVVEV